MPHAAFAILTAKDGRKLKSFKFTIIAISTLITKAADIKKNLLTISRKHYFLLILFSSSQPLKLLSDRLVKRLLVTITTQLNSWVLRAKTTYDLSHGNHREHYLLFFTAV